MKGIQAFRHLAGCRKRRFLDQVQTEICSFFRAKLYCWTWQGFYQRSEYRFSWQGPLIGAGNRVLNLPQPLTSSQLQSRDTSLPGKLASVRCSPGPGSGFKTSPSSNWGQTKLIHPYLADELKTVISSAGILTDTRLNREFNLGSQLRDSGRFTLHFPHCF